MNKSVFAVTPASVTRLANLRGSLCLAVLLTAGLASAASNATIFDESPYSTGLNALEASVNAANVKLLENEALLLRMQATIDEQRNVLVSSREFIMSWAVFLALAFGAVNFWFWQKLVLRTQQERLKLEKVQLETQHAQAEAEWFEGVQAKDKKTKKVNK